MRLRRLLAITVTAGLALTATVAAGADAEPGDHHDPVFQTTDLPALPSFNESPGCYALDGIRGPNARQAGRMPSSEPILGPWGDMFGRSIGAVHAQLVTVTLPNSGGKVFYVHRRVAPALERVAANLRREARRGNTYTIRSDSYSYAPYTIPPRTHMSFHAIGAAIDINARANPYRADNKLITDMPDWFVQAWTDAGWCWGGHWQTIKDPMHFSWRGPIHDPGGVIPTPYPPVSTPDLRYSTRLQFDTPVTGHLPPGISLVGDLDRDGAPDLATLVPSSSVGLPALLWSSSYRGFETCSVTGPFPHWVSSAFEVALADGTVDGRADLVTAALTDYVLEVTVFPIEDPGRPLPTIASGLDPAGLTRVVFADADGDGHLDAYGLYRSGDQWVVALSAPVTAAPMPLATLTSVSEPQFASGDMNLDGTHELVMVDRRRLTWVASDGEVFSAAVPAATPGAGETFGVFDVDGDGRRDLVFTTDRLAARVQLASRPTVDDPTYWFVDQRRDWEFAAGCSLPPDPMSPVEVAAALPDGSLVEFTQRTGGAQGGDRHSVSWTRPDGAPVTRSLPGPAVAAAVTEDGDTLLVVARRAEAQLLLRSFDIATGTLTSKTPVAKDGDPVSLGRLPDGTIFVVIDSPDPRPGMAVFLAPETGARTSHVLRKSDPAVAAVDSAAGALHVVGTWRGLVRVHIVGPLDPPRLAPSGRLRGIGTPNWFDLAQFDGQRLLLLYRVAGGEDLPPRLRLTGFDPGDGYTRLDTVALGRSGFVEAAAGRVGNTDLMAVAFTNARGKTVARTFDTAAMSPLSRRVVDIGFDPLLVEVRGGSMLLATVRLLDGATRVHLRSLPYLTPITFPGG